MKVVVTIAALNPEHGGPARTLPALCLALTQLGVEIEIITVGEHGRPVDAAVGQGLNVTTISTSAGRYHPRSWRRAFESAVLRALGGRADVVLYDLGLWLPSNHFASEVAAKTRIPRVVSPRGMLSREALSVSRWKKRVAWHLYQRRDLRRASVFHATSAAEAKDFRAVGLTQPIAVVPNGVDLPLASSGHTTDGEPRTALFLSRLHPIKGLRDLVTAWARVRPKGWQLVVAGPDENGHRVEIEKLATSLRVHEDLTFTGSVDNQKKWELLQQADFFVLPSYSESFGLVIAEALAAGVPVITTRATPWKEIETVACGWWIDTGVEALVPALLAAMGKTPEELHDMGQRGRNLVQNGYSWQNAAKMILPVFEWLIGRTNRPTFFG